MPPQPTTMEKLVARALLFREILLASLPARIAAGFALMVILLGVLMIPGHWGRVTPARWVKDTPGRCFWGNMENRLCWRADPKQNPAKTPHT
ncbi:MAG TPA: hypothetical protein VMF58_08845 [Rhizomicrobium sp.]|nr:hypothetical protein [Rhizomicrobium sp.]